MTKKGMDYTNIHLGLNGDSEKWKLGKEVGGSAAVIGSKPRVQSFLQCMNILYDVLGLR